MVRNLLDVYRKWQTGGPRRGDVRVHAAPSAIIDVFNKLPDEELATVARAIAATPSLQPVPGWRFGSFQQSANLAVHIRHSLWLQAQTRPCAPPVDVLWHAGTQLRLHLDNDLSQTLFSAGMFEPNEFALLDRVLRPGMVFIDGGANEGAYTVFAAARVGPAGRVIAIEPSARERERLKVNIDANGFDNVTVVEAALAEHSGAARLTIAEPLHAGQNTLGAFAYAGVGAAGSAEVALTTLDALASKYRLKRVDIMKLDLEGAEYRALSAARRLLARHRPLIISELSENSLLHQGASAAMLLQLFEDANYRVFAMSSETGEPVPRAAGDSSESDTIVAVHAERDWPGLWRDD
jgi:FkbM family methyltransferase